MTHQSLIITLLVVISLLGLTLYYIKFKSDEKAKIKSQGRKDIDASADKYDSHIWREDMCREDDGRYAEIIDDYPTHIRNK